MKQSVFFLHNRIALLLLFMTTNQIAIAARTDYSLGLNAEYSDNASLQPTDEQSDVKMSALAGILLTENSAVLDANIRGLLEFVDYKEDTYSDETLRDLNADVTWTIRPSSLFWVVEDYYSQVQRNILGTNTPDNLINTNVFSTGPNAFFRINNSNRLEVRVRTSDYEFEGTNADSTRNSINVGWINAFNSSLEISLNADYQRAEFVEVDDADFDRQDYYIRFDYEYSRSNIQMDFGKTFIDREVSEDVDGYLTRFIWRNQFREQSFFQIDALTQFTDSGQDLLSAGAASEDLDRAGTQVSGDVFYDRRLEATYHIGSGFSSYDVRLSYREEDFKIAPQDRVSKNARFNYNYVFSSTTQIASFFEHSKNDSVDAGQENQQNNVGFLADYRLSRDYTLRLELNHVNQNSNVSTANYDENRILLSFYYGQNPQSYR